MKGTIWTIWGKIQNVKQKLSTMKRTPFGYVSAEYQTNSKQTT